MYDTYAVYKIYSNVYSMQYAVCIQYAVYTMQCNTYCIYAYMLRFACLHTYTHESDLNYIDLYRFISLIFY